MGVVAAAVGAAEEMVVSAVVSAEEAVLGTSPTGAILGAVGTAVGGEIGTAISSGNVTGIATQKTAEYDPITGAVEQYLIAPIDKAVFGHTFEDLRKEGKYAPIEPEFKSRIIPARFMTESNVDVGVEEDLEEGVVLGKSRKNRLRVPLTGGVDIGSAGVGAGTPPSASTSATGLSV